MCDGSQPLWMMGQVPASLPFLTTYDPPGKSEGNLDPLGLYQIADQLASQLVPGVRERMQRIRFLTAMAVGSLVTEGLEEDPRSTDASPYLVWEWLIVESLIRDPEKDLSIWGVPGTRVTRTALARHGYLDARSYLKTPRVFGFHGVYKRLAVHLGLLDVHLGPRSHAERLADAWARDQGLGGVAGAQGQFERWRLAVRRSLNHSPPRTKLASTEWVVLAKSFAPGAAKVKEKRLLQKLLRAEDDRKLGALPQIWQLLVNHGNGAFREEALHVDLERKALEYKPLVKAIRAYEAFARGLQDAFDVLRAEAAAPDARGYSVPRIAGNQAFRKSVDRLDERFAAAHCALGEITTGGFSVQNQFDQRFGSLAEPMDAKTCALTLCKHHQMGQQRKSADGKRPWFDRIDSDRIYIRQAYRIQPREIASTKYVHPYRGSSIRSFRADLA